MARVLNKIIELLSNHKEKLAAAEPRNNTLEPILAEETQSISQDAGDLTGLDLTENQHNAKPQLSEKEQFEVEDYCTEKRVKFKLTELGFMLDGIDSMLQELQKVKKHTKAAQMKMDLLEGVKDTEYSLTEARELVKQTQKCQSELQGLVARADFVLQACKHICETPHSAELTSSPQV